jgi:hypothetical protein
MRQIAAPAILAAAAWATPPTAAAAAVVGQGVRCAYSSNSTSSTGTDSRSTSSSMDNNRHQQWLDNESTNTSGLLKRLDPIDQTERR